MAKRSGGYVSRKQRGDGVSGVSSFAQRRHVKARATYNAPRRPRSWIGCQHLRLGSLSRDTATRRSSVRLVRELDLRAAGLVRIRDRKHRVMRAAATLAGQCSNPCVKRDSVREEE